MRQFGATCYDRGCGQNEALGEVIPLAKRGILNGIRVEEVQMTVIFVVSF
jgi:hypothetical protein